MIRVVADTHTLVWALFNDPRLSQTAKDTIDQTIANGNEVGISAITVVERVYLVEKGRLPLEALNRTLAQLRDPVSALVTVALDDAVAETMRVIARSDVLDMPDRIIAATAVHLGVPVISKDRKISLSTVQTIW